MNWITNNPQLAIAIAGVVFSIIGYYYRVWRESQENLKEALFLLAEIWHRSTVAFNAPIQMIFDVLSRRVREIFPHEEFTEEQEAAMRAHFVPILEKSMRFHALDGIESLYGAYERVVALISRSDPLFAYDLGAASTIKRRLAFVDQYFQEAFQPLDEQGGGAKVLSNALRQNLKNEVVKDANQELEKHLRRLALKLGMWMWLNTNIRILKRKRLLKKGPDIGRVDEIMRGIPTPSG